MRGSSQRVLIVDPHPEALITFERLLEDAGCDTETAWTGEDAVRLLRSRHFDAVLLNDYLPGSSCEALLQEIVGKRDKPAVVVMQPAASAMDDGARFLRIGACEVVCKHDLAAVKHAVWQATSARVTRTRQQGLRAAG